MAGYETCCVYFLTSHDNLGTGGDKTCVDSSINTTTTSKDIIVDMAPLKHNQRAVPGGVVGVVLGQVTGTIDIIYIQRT